MKNLDLIAALKHGTEVSNGNPLELLFPEGKSDDRWNKIKTSSFYSDTIDELKESAQRFLREPIPCIPFSEYKQFDITGERRSFERIYFDRRLRLNTFALLTQLEGGSENLHALEDVLWAICDEYTWCLPAHLKFESLKAVPSNREHRKEIDLFAAETAFYLGEIVHLMGDHLSEIVIHRIKKEVRERVLDSFVNSTFHWETSDMNWAAVCGGSVGAAAMYLIEDDEELGVILERVLKTMDCFLSGFSADGACLEGISYWNYGFGLFVYFSALLKQRTAGQLDLMQNEHVKKIALFQQKSYLSENHVVSFSDTNLTHNFHLGLSHYLKQLFNEMEIPNARYRAGLIDSDRCYRWAHVIRNLIWSEETWQGEDWDEAFYHLEHAGIVVSRTRQGNDLITLAAKGGHNAEPHNHNDLGSFILHVNGYSLFVDPGKGVYTKDYFTEHRYELVSNGSQGHSVPIIDGQLQQEGDLFTASLVDVNHSDLQDTVKIDLTGAYAIPYLAGLTRLFVFNKQKRELTLTDSYEFQQQPTAITERFVTFFKPKLISDGHLRIHGTDSIYADLFYDAKQMEYEGSQKTFIPKDPDRENLHLIDLKVKSPSPGEQIQFKIHLHT